MFRLPILTSFILFLSIAYAMQVESERRSLGVDHSSLPAAVKSICKGGMNATTVLESKPFGNDGVTITTGFCTPPDSDSDPATNLAAAAPVVRQACSVTAPDTCTSRFGNMYQGNGWVNKCGAPCDSACNLGSGGPDPNDCQSIVNQMNQKNPALLALDPGNFALMTQDSCASVLIDQIQSPSIGCSQRIIYDYPDWASVTHYLAWNCQAAQKARGGTCTGETSLYQSGIPDFYIQVYLNAQ